MADPRAMVQSMLDHLAARIGGEAAFERQAVG
jgi:hypothetical protein